MCLSRNGWHSPVIPLKPVWPCKCLNMKSKILFFGKTLKDVLAKTIVEFSG